jgi:hypothetical protein
MWLFGGCLLSPSNPFGSESYFGGPGFHLTHPSPQTQYSTPLEIWIMHHRLQWNKREVQALIRLKSNSNPFGELSANGENAFLTPFLCEESAGSDHCKDVRQHMNHQI